MKRILAGLLAVLVVCWVPAFAELNVRDVLAKIATAYSAVKEMSADISIGMDIMGNPMIMSGKMWAVGERMRMDLTIPMPGMDRPMEKVMISDGKTLRVYQKALNLVTLIDLQKLPEGMRQQVQRQQGFFMNTANVFPEEYLKAADKFSVSEKTRDGVRQIVLQTDKLQDLAGGAIQPGLGAAFLQKMSLWVDPGTYLVNRAEFYGEGDTPGLWMEFRNLRCGPVSSEVFALMFPPDVRVMDMTESILKMMESMKR